MAKKINYTLAGIIEAGISDKTPKAYFLLEDWNGATCAVGGAAVTLGVRPYLVERSLKEIEFPGLALKKGYEGESLGEQVEMLSDGTKFKKATIWQRLMSKLTPAQLAKKVRIA